MDARAAKAIALNIRDIVIAQTQKAILEAKVVVLDCDLLDCDQRINTATDRIATWLQQPMTFR